MPDRVWARPVRVGVGLPVRDDGPGVDVGLGQGYVAEHSAVPPTGIVVPAPRAGEQVTAEAPGRSVVIVVSWSAPDPIWATVHSRWAFSPATGR